MRTALTGPLMHHSWAFYLTLVLLAVTLLLLLHGDVAEAVTRLI